MDYNNYYATPSPMQNPPQQVQMIPTGVNNNMMHVSSPMAQPHTPQNIRQVVTPGTSQGQPMNQNMQNQPHPGLMHHSQLAPSGHQHPPPPTHNYHQQLSIQHQTNPSPLPHTPHSASPASHIHSPHQHNLQQPPRPATGPSPHPHMHQQSPHLLGGPPPQPMHIQPQSMNSMNGAPGGQHLISPNGMVNGQTQPPPPHQQTGMHHNQGFIPGSSPMSSLHYSQAPPPPTRPPSHSHTPTLVGPPPPQNQGHAPPPHMSTIQQHQNLHPPHLPPPNFIPHPGNPQNHPDGGSPFDQNMSQTEFRIIELNKRLQNKPSFRYSTTPMPFHESEEHHWWERFASDFFNNESTLTLQSKSQDSKLVEYKIGRTLIPRFFRSYFAGGVIDLSIKLRNSKETIQNSSLITLDCDQADITTTNIYQPGPNLQPIRVIVHTEGRLTLEFISGGFDTLLIKSWKFFTRDCREYIDRSAAAINYPYIAESVTRSGLTKQTLSFLKMCMIMEPMQELMYFHKQTKRDPRSCLIQLLVDKYNHKIIDDQKAQPPKRRKRRTPAATEKRKSPAAPATAASTTSKKPKSNATNPSGNRSGLSNNIMMSPAKTPSFLSPTQDVIAVGDPSIIGNEFGEATSDNHTLSPSVLQQRQHQQLQQQPDKAVTNQIKVEQVNMQESSQEGENQDQMNQADIVERNDELLHHHQQEHDSQQEQQQQEHNQEQQQHNKEQQQEHQLQEHHQEEKQELQQEHQQQEHQQQEHIQQEHQQQEHQHEPQQEYQQEHEQLNEDTSLILQQHDQNQEEEALVSEEKPPPVTAVEENAIVVKDEAAIQTSEESVEKENRIRFALSPHGSTTKTSVTSNGSNNKQNRRRSSERKETLREGLMRTQDFVVAMKDLKKDHPALWRITTGNNLLQQYEPKTENGVVLYENTNQYGGWNPEIRRDYVGVDVKLTQHTRNNITVERLLLNFQKIEDEDVFYDKHFAVYLQIIISIALDTEFWESIANEPEHHDYFLTSHRIIEDVLKRFKIKLSSKLKLSEATIKNIEKYPNLIIKAVEKEEKEQTCRACNTKTSTQVLSFGNRSYDLHSFKPVKVTSELTKVDDKDLYNHICDDCLEIVNLYSEVHHTGWKLYNLSREKVELHRVKGKPINEILDECLKDQDWLAKIYAERDSLWSRV